MSLDVGEIFLYDVKEILGKRTILKAEKGQSAVFSTEIEPFRSDVSHSSAVERINFFPEIYRSRSKFPSPMFTEMPSDFPAARPVMFTSASLDGTVRIQDIRDPATGVILSRNRCLFLPIHWAPQWGGLFLADSDFSVKFWWPQESNLLGNRAAVTERSCGGAQKLHSTTWHRASVWVS